MKRAIILTVLILATPAQALYCGANLVLVGQTQDRILQNCGAPTYASSGVTTLPGAGWSPWTGAYPPLGFYGSGQFGPALVEEWIYNFGATKLMPRLVFENGVLRSIRYHGYGR